MIKRFLKKGILPLILAVTLLLSSISVQADSVRSDSGETEDSYAEDTSYSRLRGSHLNFGNVKISKLSSNEINIYGITQCHHDCQKVWLSLFLEKKVDGVYETYKMWDFTDEDASNLDMSINVIVQKGTYYRLRGYHAAADDGLKESTTTLTDGILVK